jgi:hypothetical protein
MNMTPQTSSIMEIVRQLLHDVRTLVVKEFELAKAEAGEKFEQVQTGVVSILFGMLVGFCALLVLVQAVVVALSKVMPPSLAAAAVGVVLGVIAYVAIRTGETHLKPRNLAPRRTMRSLGEQASHLKESME